MQRLRNTGVSEHRVVLGHDYLTQRGGAERVVLEMARLFPEAPMLTSFYDVDATYPGFAAVDVRASWLSQIGVLRRDPRRALPLLPFLFGLRRAPTGVLLVSSSGWAHALRAAGPKVVYCHNPARWLYQPDDYFSSLPRPLRHLLTAALWPLRLWDQRASRSATIYLANSTAVARRIADVYGITAEVVHPPAALDATDSREPVPGVTPGFLLTVGRRRGYKNTLLVCEAAERAGRRLVVVGGLPDRSEPWPDDLVGVSDISDAALRWLYAECAGVVAMSREDFGLTPVEGFVFGKPCLALRAGGYLDSCVEGVTGSFVDRPDVATLSRAMLNFDPGAYDPEAIRHHAIAFGTEQFGVRLQAAVDRAVRSVCRADSSKENSLESAT